MKKLLLLTLCFIGLSNANAQSRYKEWVKAEKKDATYTRKEVKKAAKEYAELIYEDAKDVNVSGRVFYAKTASGVTTLYTDSATTAAATGGTILW